MAYTATMENEPKDVRLPLMVTKTEAEAIDKWRYFQQIPSRAEAIRQLIQAGLTVPPRAIDLLDDLEFVGLLSDERISKSAAALDDALGTRPLTEK